MNITQSFKQKRLDNGITVIGEQMDFVSSAAFAILVPLGAATDPEGQEGAAALLAELFNKGAGPFDSRALSDEFEKLGVQRSHNSGIEISTFTGALLGENLNEALRLYRKVLREPHLPDDELEAVKQLALQDIRALEDEPAGKTMSELAKVFYPYPFGRSQLGTVEGIEEATSDSLRAYYEQMLVPNRMIIGLAGSFDWEDSLACIEQEFGSWVGSSTPLSPAALRKNDFCTHIARDTSQLQIALAYPSVPISDPRYYAAKIAVGVLSGGMSGRLFIEVREKRGLVYRVSASHSAAKGRAAVFASAGTTPENGEETLEVMLRELKRIGEGASDEELARAKADLKSRIVMQSELSSVRASALVNDWWNLERLRTIDEVKSGIDAVTSEAIEALMQDFPVSPITMVTLGPKALELPK